MIEFLKELCSSGGEMALEYRSKLEGIDVQMKGGKDLVTEADRAIEDLLCRKIKAKFPDHTILGEETGHWEGSDERWIIDPIDGTTSFFHGQPYFSISIAYEKAGVVEAGAVFAPVLQECFLAERGQGATLNGESISTSSTSELQNSLLATGFACLRSELEHNNLPYLCHILPKIRDMRRMGSAAIDLCYVACGRLDGFWELNLNLYDIAAGKLILEEAGGDLTDFKGENIKNCMEIMATNGPLHPALTHLMETVNV